MDGAGFGGIGGGIGEFEHDSVKVAVFIGHSSH